MFGKNKSTISRHLSNIYKEEELDQEATVAKKATVQIEGNRKVEREIEYYNLDAIISVDDCTCQVYPVHMHNRLLLSVAQ
ncbi:hypothetical protein [Pedobacter sp. V48]|uniref:hypothetical protein n=1 Tax=Pedobacter sp. V48 TaxID=509635 RepID=UPI0004B6839F|nr:hypothetical protein [Pedobacter sp. V48]